MTPEQSAAYVMGQAACLNAEIAGMQAENMQRAALGQSMAYDEVAFIRVIDKYSCHHNAACSAFEEANR